MMLRQRKTRKRWRKAMKVFTFLIWVLALLLNLLPIICSAGYDENTSRKKGDKKGLEISFIVILYVGICLPLLLTSIAKILTIVALKKNKQKKNAEKENESIDNDNFGKLVNGLVIWLILCNAPYIAWYHWALSLYLRTGGLWKDTPGVITLQ